MKACLQVAAAPGTAAAVKACGGVSDLLQAAGLDTALWSAPTNIQSQAETAEHAAEPGSSSGAHTHTHTHTQYLLSMLKDGL